MTPNHLRQSADFDALKAAAARLGRDRMQIQGPGGNISLKMDGVMLVKASGTWLADAASEDIFTAVDAAAMKRAVLSGEDAADDPQRFQIAEGLKPSIETGFHAALDTPVVLHTHCVATLARATAPVPKAQLDALGLVWVDYVKPGAALAQAILQAWHADARGVMLGNHGIIAVGQTVAEAENVLRKSREAFDSGPVPHRAPAPSFQSSLDETGWKPLGAGATTALAFDPARLRIALGAAFFPDQVIFLGPAPCAMEEHAIKAPDWPRRALALVPDRGAAIPVDASAAQEALAEMIGEVVFRLPTHPNRLKDHEIADLLGWDAEKYRQSLEQARTERLKGSQQQ
ncbi:class II aldolase/adducin family protein [Ruegeria sp. 2205SS24-7]|uniref:class II aldolase/adducin family protein n=1 Tax=Ruegeria discodermiae TaxID=3064389 RepID=UPI002740493A|nr:class II aldolase/adducin family protein [Ruegeria sp. 2205SS24-7]MDP5220962.1 class II aldolase/adducin family protein [Ruegeria sp. 2205SS24-7]